jgi:hypothetical protein
VRAKKLIDKLVEFFGVLKLRPVSTAVHQHKSRIRNESHEFQTVFIVDHSIISTMKEQTWSIDAGDSCFTNRLVDS